MTAPPLAERVTWTEADRPHSALWRSEGGLPAPRRIAVVDDRLKADAAYKLVCEGTALLWRGDFHNARQLLTALARRMDRRPRKAPVPPDHATQDPALAFHRHRAAQHQRARILGMLLVPLSADYTVPLRRAPHVHDACVQAYGPVDGRTEHPDDTAGPAGTRDADGVGEADADGADAGRPGGAGGAEGSGGAGGSGGVQGSAGTGDGWLVSLRELLGVVGAWEWRRKGVEIPALGGDRVHPFYGVFSPVRGEYVDLVARAPLPAEDLAFDIGTGTGVLAAVLARRGVARVVATDLAPRALACARENVTRLGVGDRVEVVAADLFPEGRAPLVVCNPPWVPAKPTSAVEHAVYDPGSRMLRGFLTGLPDHLTPGGEGWLILSDLAEHLGLRARTELPALIDAAGLRVLDRLDIAPRHPRVRDTTDPLHTARAAEVTSLWRLAAAR